MWFQNLYQRTGSNNCVLEQVLSDTPVEPCPVAAQTSADGFKEAAESCAGTLAVSVYLKQGLQMGGDF